MLNKVKEWHENALHNFQKALRLDDYHMMWLAFGKGVVLVLLLQWIF
jgi:hypothetical protein